MEDLIKKLKSIKHRGVNPKKEWLEKNRKFLLSQISNTVTKESGNKFDLSAEKMWKFMSVFLPRTVVYSIVRPVAIVAMVLSLGTGGWIATVAASQDTVPGDALHSTKMLTEKVHIAVLSAIDAKDTQTKKRVNYAKRRAEEVQKLATSEDQEKIERVPEAMKVLKEEVKKVEEDIKEIKESEEVSKKVTAVVVKEVEKNTKEIGDILKDIEKGLVNSTSTTKETKVDLIEVKKVSAETSVTAMEVMVEKHMEGDTTVTTKEVKDIIQEKAEELSVKAKINTTVLNKATKETKKASDAKLISTSTTKNTIVNSTTIKQEQLIKDVNKKTEEAATKAGEAEKEMDSRVQETGNLLDKGDLENALKVVVEASKTVAEALISKDKTIVDLQEISPEVVSIVLLEVDTEVSISTDTLKNSTTTIINTTTEVDNLIEVEVENNIIEENR